ncbi:cytochrome P450 [Trinickia dabaoshanensis]|nr:cytochrome P450 [Trinickia dabaoshanensis]
MTHPFPADPIAAVTHPNPYPYYAQLRNGAPLIRDETLKLWVAARADTVRAILDDARLTVRPVGEPVPRTIAGGPAGEIYARLARMTEGDTHRVARQALVKGLGGVDIVKVRESSSREAAAVMARYETCDAALLDTLAFAIPVRIVAELAGLPPNDALAATVRQFVACLSPLSPPEALDNAHTAATALQAKLHALTRAEASTSPLIERIVSGGLEASEELPNALVSNLLGLFSQTFEATAGLIGNGIVTLATHPELIARLQASPADIDAFVREVARFDPAVHNTRRFARELICMDGATLQPGDAVLVVLAAASRDEASFHAPERFMLDRPEHALPGFGAGRHACPGEAIARTIASGVLAALVTGGFDFADPALRWSYQPSSNGRIPRFNFIGSHAS